MGENGSGSQIGLDVGVREALFTGGGSNALHKQGIIAAWLKGWGNQALAERVCCDIGRHQNIAIAIAFANNHLSGLKVAGRNCSGMGSIKRRRIIPGAFEQAARDPIKDPPDLSKRFARGEKSGQRLGRVAIIGRIAAKDQGVAFKKSRAIEHSHAI
jgi:hypothetical protein